MSIGVMSSIGNRLDNGVKSIGVKLIIGVRSIGASISRWHQYYFIAVTINYGAV